MSQLIPDSGYIYTTDHVSHRGFIADKDKQVMVITAPSGRGKTTLADKLCVDYIDENQPPNPIYERFDCSDKKTFCRDVSYFYRKVWPKWELQILEPTWNLVNKLSDEVTKLPPNQLKLFVFENVKELDDVLKHLDDCCRPSQRDPSRKLKIFVTAQRKVSRPEDYPNIRKDCFVDLQDLNDDDVRKFFPDGVRIEPIVDAFGSLPVVLRVFAKSMSFSQRPLGEQIANFKVRMKRQARGGTEAKISNALMTIKTSLDDFLTMLDYPDKSKQLMKGLTLFHEGYLFDEMMISYAETVTPDPEQARLLVVELTERMAEWSMCHSFRDENDNIIYCLHPLVREAMELYIGEDEDLDYEVEKISLIRNASIALARVIPIDGRNHRTRVVSYYNEHGKRLDDEIRNLGPNINRRETPLTMLLRCKILLSIGYCELSQRVSSPEDGTGRLKQARDQYCLLVFGKKYKAVVDSLRTIHEEVSHERIVTELYENGQGELSMFENEEYKDYVAKLPEYHRLTAKDKEFILEDPADPLLLVNSHVTTGQLEMFAAEGKVIDVERLGPVVPVEILAQIFYVWSIDYCGIPQEDRLLYMEAAHLIYDRIKQDHNILLLSSVTNERYLIEAKLRAVNCTNEEAQRSIERLQKLEKLEGDTANPYGFESGIIRSYLPNDHYHKMVCVQNIIRCHGHLDGYEEGRELLKDVVAYARRQNYADKKEYVHNALTYCYQKYADFCSMCKMPDEACFYIIKAMEELGLYMGANEQLPHHRRAYKEFRAPRFDELYKDLEQHHQAFCDISVGQSLLTPDHTEYKYLTALLENNENRGGGRTEYPLLKKLVDQV